MNENSRSSRRLVKKMVFIAIAIVCAVILIAVLAIVAARAYNAHQSRIGTDTGIQENIYVPAGGIEQYLQIRSEDKDNPVILWLHGGPGNPLSYLTYYYQRPLEKDYTIVYWEQRGCGRTFYRNEDSGELTIERLLTDTDEIVDDLRERFDQEKIVIAGHSWGTVLGMEYVNTHPEKVAAYIGVGQVTDFSQGKIHAAQIASQAAFASGNKEDSALLERHIEELSKAESIDQVNAESLEEMIITSLKYLRPDGEMSGVEQAIVGVTAPEMLWDDMRWFLFESDTKNIFDVQGKLVDYMYFRFDVAKLSSEYDIPICFIQGDSDWITPTDMVAEYYSGITAEKKEMVTIENAGHTPFLDNPGRFCEAIETFLSGCEIE